MSDDIVEAIRRSDSLAELAAALGADDVDEAYFRAKDTWEAAVRRAQATRPEPTGLPGTTVRVDDRAFHVHGVTHAGTPEEGAFLCEHVSRFHEGGAGVYCEQGIRPLYFDDVPAVREMDDYRWAIGECTALDDDSRVEDVPVDLPGTGDRPMPPDRDDRAGLDVDAVAETFREATFSLIESGAAAYGDRFERALGDVVDGFFADHADVAVGRSYEGFTLSRAASRNPDRLTALQRYYERTFLPQPLEREWLRRHDPELELVTHARNERMADYAVYHAGDAADVHLIVGAAHQPGVVYYLDRYRRGRELPEPFVLC